MKRAVCGLIPVATLILQPTGLRGSDPRHRRDDERSDVGQREYNCNGSGKTVGEHGISAVPIVDKHNQAIDIVSGGDLLYRAETGTERRRAWWLDMVPSTNKLAGDYINSHNDKVKDVMTRNVLSVTETTPGYRHRARAGDEPDQGRSGRARRQTRRHRQLGETCATARYDDQRGGEPYRTELSEAAKLLCASLETRPGI